jgi:DNA polymerase III alpha subunit
MRMTLRDVDARSPQDILVALALYRPGPLTGGLKEAFIRRHLGKESVEHLHPSLGPLLQETYGVILYQEQVLRILSQLAGLSLADADLMRRAMSHFDPGERMQTLRQRFVEGALDRSGVPVHTGEQIWELMAAFAGYGFPKAHAASYARVAWQSAWCKAHFPGEFIAAVLANWGGYYGQRMYMSEARRLGLPVRPPQVNYARPEFSLARPQGTAALFVGLNQVRGLTRRTIQRILSERPFHSMSDFLTRVDPKPAEAESLARVGALAGYGTIPELLAQINRGGWRYAQPTLFELPRQATAEEWSLAERVAAQEELLGVPVDAHPLELLPARLIESANCLTTAQALELRGQTVRVLGIRQTLQRFFDQEGRPFYRLELEDTSGVFTVLVPSELYRRQRALLSTRRPFVVEGKVWEGERFEEVVLHAERIADLAPGI